MPKIELKNPEVAEKYELTGDVDVTVNTERYHGEISNINLAGADYMVKSKSQYIKEKEVKAATEAKEVKPAPNAGK